MIPFQDFDSQLTLTDDQQKSSSIEDIKPSIDFDFDATQLLAMEEASETENPDDSSPGVTTDSLGAYAVDASKSHKLKVSFLRNYFFSFEKKMLRRR